MVLVVVSHVGAGRAVPEVGDLTQVLWQVIFMLCLRRQLHVPAERVQPHRVGPAQERGAAVSAREEWQQRITDWIGLHRKGPLNVTWTKSCSWQERLQLEQVILPSNLTCNDSRSGTSTTSLGDLSQCLTLLNIKNVFLLSRLHLPLLV